MHLERRTVSRKTPKDGKLEITKRSAESVLARVPSDLDILVNGAAGRGRVTTMPCTCRGEGNPHVHYFIEGELLKALAPESEVSVAFDEEARSVVIDDWYPVPGTGYQSGTRDGDQS
jgi:hypothetical protein